VSATTIPFVRRTESRIGPWLASGVLLTGLAAIVAARWWAARAGFDPLAVGAVFGLALTTLAIGRRPIRALRVPARDVATGIAVGTGFGLVLVAVVATGAAIGGSTFVPGIGRPATAFLPWAAITVLVASGEEVLLRGRIFDVLRRAGGVLPAIVVTTVAFALMHVPLYGWHVVPLDLAVGLAFAGLRLATGRVIAPASAHALADLATWWLPL
jgi:membrane protease YdiL (CAAX protease family)